MKKTIKKTLIGGPGRAKPRNKNANDYINNRLFLEALGKYKEIKIQAKKDNKEEPIPSNYIGECILLICNNLSKNKNFIGYSPLFKEEMIADGIEKCSVAVKNFDPNISKNPFGYFTQIAYNAFIARITKEKKQSVLKHKNFINSFVFDDVYNFINDDEKRTMSQASNPLVDDFISKFEESENKKKLKAKEKSLLKKKQLVEKFIEE